MSFGLDLGDASAILAFAGVLYKLHRKRAEGRALAGMASPSRPGQGRMQSLAQLSNGGASMDSVRKKMASLSTTKKVKNVSTADQRVKFIKDMVDKYGNDPDVRKITGDLLTGRMDVWGRIMDDNQFNDFRMRRAGSTGQPWAVPEKNWNAEVQRIFTFVRNQVRYTRDPSTIDTYTGPLRTVAFYNIGDCDCYTILASSMLKAVGYSQKIRIIWLRGAPTWGHIYLMVGMPPTGIVKWVPFDASIDKPLGTQAPPAMVYKYKDFMLP